jgi:competence protein ComEC
MKKETKLGLGFILFLFCVAVFVFYQIFVAESGQPLTKVDFFNVGEGDCALVEMPNSIQMLIDGGPSRQVVEKIAREMPFFDREIELVVLTHPDRDHITGLFEVFKTFKVDKVLIPKIEGEIAEKELYKKFQEDAHKERSEIFFAKEGQKIFFKSGGSFSVIWPKENLLSKETNDYSIVGKFSFGETNFLFTGDIPGGKEKEIIKEGFNLQSEILKIAHHGSRSSSSEDFIKEVMPKAAIISVGENKYGHPTEEVLERLEKYDIKIFRTDERGDIKIISDGQNININK